VLLREQGQDAKAVADGLGVGRDALIGQRVAPREEVDAFVVAKPGGKLFDQ
jgi:hypothetical protein